MMPGMNPPTPILTPRLVVAGADQAIAFYRLAFGAELLERYADPHGHVVHAALSIEGVVVSLTEEKKDWNNVAPTSLGGTPVILSLTVEDADQLGVALEEAGAEVVFPISDQFYGHREGRFRDPFGHLWIITEVLETLSPEEIEARMNQGA